MTHEPFDAHAAAYALGALDGEERAEFERHLATNCPRCQASLRASEEALATLASRLPPVLPPPGVRAALLQRIDADAARRGQAVRPARWGPALAATAAAALVVGALAAGLLVAGRYESRLARLTAEVGTLRAEREQLEALLRERESAQALLDLLRDPATRLVALRGAGPSPEAIGRIVWHERAGGWVVVAKLPPARPGTTYELWTITGGRPSPAGLFDVDASGVATRRIEATGGPVDTFAVTLEPAGGVPTPTGPIVLAAR